MMDPVEFEHEIRRALGDDLRWRILTSDEDGREQAADWLRAAVAGVRSDRKIRKARSIADQLAAGKHTRAGHAAGARFAEWEARSRGFEARVIRRLRNLGLNEQGHRIGGRRDAALERSRAHAANCEQQRRHAVNSLADLASLVESFVNSGPTSVADLDRALDELTVAHHDGDTTTTTLRELLAGKRAVYASDPSKESTT